MDENMIEVDLAPVRKKISERLMSIDVTDMDSSGRNDAIKEVLAAIPKYNSFFDSVTSSTVSEHETNRIYVVLDGMRMETEEEFRRRVGIYENESWTYGFMKLTGCSAELAKREMQMMVLNGVPRTPREWREDRRVEIDFSDVLDKW